MQDAVNQFYVAPELDHLLVVNCGHEPGSVHSAKRFRAPDSRTVRNCPLPPFRQWIAFAEEHAERDRCVHVDLHRRDRSLRSILTAENDLGSLIPRTLRSALKGSVGTRTTVQASFSETRRATARRWEVTSTSSPCSTSRRYALRFCLREATLTVSVFMSTIWT